MESKSENKTEVSAGMSLFLAMFILLFLAPTLWSAETAESQGSDDTQWWQRGQDGWYFKDDWKGAFLQGRGEFKKTVDISGKVRQAFIYVWGAGQYELKVNDRLVGSDMDNGTIEDYDLTNILKSGENTIVITGGGEIAAEGAAVLTDGTEIVFNSDESWGGRPSERRRRRRDNYAGLTHNARIVVVTKEQKAKVLVNKVNSASRRIANRDTYRFWKARDPREVLTVDKQTDVRKKWAQIHQLLAKAKTSAEEPTRLVKAGKFSEAIEAAQPAIELTERAEGILKILTDDIERTKASRARSLGSTTPWAWGDYLNFNMSKFNRLGWVASIEPLDNDPWYWEFDIAPGGAESIGLAGYWKFKLDPVGKGEEMGWAGPDFKEAGWKWLYAPTKWGWERHGYVRANGKDGRGANQVYNGHAWYRKTMLIPANWKGKDLVFNRSTRFDWHGHTLGNTYEVFFNGEAVGPEDGGTSQNGLVTIPADKVRFGEENTIAVRVINSNNYGGLMNPGLRISTAEGMPGNRRSICGPASVRQEIFETGEGRIEQITYSSALSPGVVVATTGKTIRLAGWSAKGYAEPTNAMYIAGQRKMQMFIGKERTVKGAELSENWMLLWTNRKSTNTPRPVLIVFEQKPAAITFSDDGFGGKQVVFSYEQSGARIALVRPFDEPLTGSFDESRIDRCRLWSKAMLAYPVGYLEQLEFNGDICKVQMNYEYVQLEDDWGTEAVKLAPLPMLFSYALEYKWPDAGYEGNAVDLGNRAKCDYYPQSDTGTYKALQNASTLTYRFNRSEPKVIYKGLGIWSEWRQPDLFPNVKKWGFNSTRPQLPIPAADEYDTERAARLLTCLERSEEQELMCVVNYFTSQGLAPQRRPEFIERWKALVERYKDKPEWLIIYDPINEPANFMWDDFDAFMKQVTEEIRKIDKKHWISMESGNGWAQPEDFDMTTHTGDEKTIYQFHNYGPHTGDCHRYDLWYPRYDLGEDRFRSYEAMEEQLLPVLRFSIQNNQTQLYHGEFGTSFIGPGTSTKDWLVDLMDMHEKYRNHWNWWNYEGVSINRTGILAGDRPNPLLEVLREYARKETPK